MLQTSHLPRGPSGGDGGDVRKRIKTANSKPSGSGVHICAYNETQIENEAKPMVVTSIQGTNR